MENHYNTLGIAPNATDDEIKKIYRSLAMRFHPDRNQAPGAVSLNEGSSWSRVAARLALAAARLCSAQSVSGKLAILNHATPGPIDQQKLPLRQFDARLGGTLTATTLESVISTSASISRSFTAASWTAPAPTRLS